MVKLLVGCHGQVGEALIEAAAMIGSNVENVSAVSLIPGMSPEDYSLAARDELQKEGLNLCLVDLFGGTPCNTFLSLSREYEIEIISGVNLPLLLEATSISDSTDIEEFKEHLLSIYQMSGFDVMNKFKKKEKTE